MKPGAAAGPRFYFRSFAESAKEKEEEQGPKGEGKEERQPRGKGREQDPQGGKGEGEERGEKKKKRTTKQEKEKGKRKKGIFIYVGLWVFGSSFVWALVFFFGQLLCTLY